MPVFKQSDWDVIDPIIKRALTEDFGNTGDVTSVSTVDEGSSVQAQIIAKNTGFLAGGSVAVRVFRKVDQAIVCSFDIQDGCAVQPGMIIGNMTGSVRSILSAERTALNFLQHLSGVATLTSEFVRRIQGTGVKILDTRKTTPGLRFLEKYAVRMGGGFNHRFGLYDRVLIKNNHIDAAGGIESAVARCLHYLAEKRLPLQIEVETRTLDEVRQALKHPIHRIMLDNMDIETMRQAVDLISGQVEIEASGNIHLENVRAVAETGVDFISIGRLTHSAPVLDMSLRVCSTIGRPNHD